MRTLALVDGEHHPPVTRAALEVAAERGHEVVAALLVGGTEKLVAGVPDLGVPVPGTGTGSRPSGGDRRARPRAGPRPVRRAVLGYRERMELAAVARRGLPYVGPDFRLDPPEQGRRCRSRRSPHRDRQAHREDAIAGSVARLAARRGLEPVVVAMGRGGPPEPTLARAGTVDLDHLVRSSRPGSTRPRTTSRTRSRPA